jgi:hypothetical protein
MKNAAAEQVIEDTVIDETFKGLVSPAQILGIGREDIGEGRPGEILVGAVVDFAAKGGFTALDNARTTEDNDNVAVSVNKADRLSIQEVKDLASEKPDAGKTSDIKE